MATRNRRRGILVAVVVLSLAAFLAWRSLRPMSTFVVSEAFARPIDTLAYEPEAGALSAARCGACHPEEHREWATSIHSRAWSDPYFRIDWAFDDRQVICKNCHIPLDRQQEEHVLGFRDKEMLDPVLVTNATFDRLIMWRPFIVDLRDTRLVRGAPRRCELRLPAETRSVEALVRYHLLAESRRQRIGYRPAEPISYPVFERRIPLY